jgi:hypothetical protein
MNSKNVMFIGYFPKINVDINNFKIHNSDDKWITDPRVIEICSVSNCMRGGPENYINHWKHNELEYFDTEDLAWSIIENDINNFTMFAYKLFLFCYRKGNKLERTKVLEIAKVIQAKLISDNFKSIGYDVVSVSVPSTENDVINLFEHSALSCNCGYKEFKTNKYCLFDSLDYAIECQKTISTGNYEPGEQYLIEVFKKDG